MAAEKRKEQLLADFETKLAEVNTAISKGTSADVETKLAQLTEIEKEFRSIRESEVFAGLMDTHQAIAKHDFTTISHKRVTDEGRMTGVEKSERTVQIDLKKFCEVKGFDLGWWYELQALNKRLTLRVAMSLGIPAAELQRVNDSYNMEKLARDIELGKTPTSDTQCVKHMQKVLDMLSPGEGKVNGHDLGYILACYSKRDNRKALYVQCSKHNFLLSLMGDVFYRIATGGVYGVSYKKVSDQKPKADDEKKPDKDSASKDSPKKNKKKGSGKKGSADSQTPDAPSDSQTPDVPTEEPMTAPRADAVA